MELEEFKKRLKNEFPNDEVVIEGIDGAPEMYTSYINGKENSFNYFTDRDLSGTGEELLKYVIIELKFLKKYDVALDHEDKQQLFDLLLED